jgi:ABC-type sugar transport system ATPase subunit
MNVLKATLEEGGRLRATGLSLPVPLALRQSLGSAAGAGREVLVGIRPEHVRPPGASSRQGQDGGEVAPVEATIEIVETLGDTQVVHARVGEGLLVFKQGPHQAPPAGAVVTLGLELAWLQLFDGRTGQRLAA